MLVGVYVMRSTAMRYLNRRITYVYASLCGALTFFAITYA
jgi:hypothetical protein